MLRITIRDFSRNMKDVSERVALGESFLVTKNSEVVFEIKPKIKKESQNLPIEMNKQRVIQVLQSQIQQKLEEINVLNQHINVLLKDEK